MADIRLGGLARSTRGTAASRTIDASAKGNVRNVVRRHCSACSASARPGVFGTASGATLQHHIAEGGS